jgi:hypothetical protein
MECGFETTNVVPVTNFRMRHRWMTHVFRIPLMGVIHASGAQQSGGEPFPRHAASPERLSSGPELSDLVEHDPGGAREHFSLDCLANSCTAITEPRPIVTPAVTVP